MSPDLVRACWCGNPVSSSSGVPFHDGIRFPYMASAPPAFVLLGPPLCDQQHDSGGCMKVQAFPGLVA